MLLYLHIRAAPAAGSKEQCCKVAIHAIRDAELLHILQHQATPRHWHRASDIRSLRLHAARLLEGLISAPLLHRAQKIDAPVSLNASLTLSP